LLLLFAPRAYGAISATTVLNSGDSTCDAAFTTSNITPTANALMFLCVVEEIGTAPVGTVTATGNSLTWVQVGTITDSANLMRATLLRASGASPTTSGVTITPSANQGNCTYSIAQVTGQDTTGTNGSGAIVGTATTATLNTNIAFSLTLPTFASSSNAGFACVGEAGTTAMTVAGGYTELGSQSGCCGSRVSTAWATNDNTYSVSLASGTTTWVGIGVEVQVPTVATRRRPPPRYYMQNFLSLFSPVYSYVGH